MGASDLGRQREDDVQIAGGQQICLAGGKPIRCRRALALWVVAVAARVVGDAAVAAVLAARDLRSRLPNTRCRMQFTWSFAGDALVGLGRGDAAFEGVSKE